MSEKSPTANAPSALAYPYWLDDASGQQPRPRVKGPQLSSRSVIRGRLVHTRLEPAVVQPLGALFDEVVSNGLSRGELGDEQDSPVAEELAVALPGYSSGGGG